MKKSIVLAGFVSSILLSPALAQQPACLEKVDCQVKIGATAGAGIFDQQNATVGANVRIEEHQYKTGAFDIRYPHFSGMHDASVQEKMNQEMQAMVKTFIEENNNEMTRTAVMQYKVRHLSPELVSLTVVRYIYTGGAHGASFMEGYTYDLATGARYNFGDLFQFDSSARADMNAQISSQIKEREIPILAPFRGVSDNPSFFIADHGQPVLFFQQYEVGPYYVGILEFPVQAPQIQ